MKVNTRDDRSSEIEWIAMIGAVASTLVVFILIMVLFIPVSEKGKFIEDKDFLALFLEQKAKDYFIIKNVEALNNEKEIQKKLVNYIDKNLTKNRKYTLLLKFGKRDDLSTGSNYINAYISSKLVLDLLLKGNVGNGGIDNKVEVDDKLTPGKFIAIVKGI